MRVSGFNLHYVSQLPAGCHEDKRSKEKRGVRVSKTLAVFARLAYTSPGKKCDKQLTHIVRVISRFIFIFYNQI
jgi:hypothetical protein